MSTDPTTVATATACPASNVLLTFPLSNLHLGLDQHLRQLSLLCLQLLNGLNGCLQLQ
jgi:hypothetical protein